MYPPVPIQVLPSFASLNHSIIVVLYIGSVPSFNSAGHRDFQLDVTGSLSLEGYGPGAPVFAVADGG